MIEALQYPFFQNAVVAALLASAVCGVIGTLVVVNRLVFMAGGMAHAAYGGVGLAVHFAWPLLPVTLLFTLGAAGVMGTVTRHRPEQADVAVGALWASGMSFGILMLQTTPGYQADLASYLFGSLFTLGGADLWGMAGLAAMVGGLLLATYKDLLLMACDRSFARARGVPVDALHFLLLGVIAVSVVMVIQMVGLVLVLALLTIPAWLARRLTRGLSAMMAVAALLAMAFSLGGLVLAWVTDLPAGATIVALAATVLLATSAIPGRR